ncbi:MAG: hypothetical protein UR85_C0005G0011 [Candidatus Nomurabacteria bacterium GW2011_GWF2_35_66]|uniref:Peptidyl-prolyl cis-trans isomerase n=1 Tax=Candidatus Nomurabacteria bacterium GW2011_GWE1_35_16 TaxID=1618761 RepID=A0A0G0EGI3_9BACT|nr:MAG: hypothetical protein UR55_C0006G0012 [Candidatus Nomurabacteria bacterium GW2011_GWF1_34_20]KKP63240.1 MAG: hypothetical protein UR57_C0007G0012 [Candidatus Nomurabacteria bacterium GW2011_GWE2_34_25]KKP66442.1 MAG: hypothetical protein UR64_C0007G0011 [Candidatus Nomurabacteria bacterium GW2011_GWE1_35_16]KKP83336.1 MAG: hypothetical protein UR85_C0005G0011 [Candidatus Nomurabacteria bacterium GW2011_GWF2_35_66]HAE36481.1 hypothetical protein [Candidatus Nomurabacteria bacterium]
MQNQKGNIWVIVAFIIVAGLIGLVIYSLMNKTTKVDPLEGIKSGDVSEQLQANEEPIKKEGQLLNKQKNMEQISKNGDTLVMNYTGRFVDGKVFDSNVDPKFGHVEPFEFQLGAGRVIKGWDEGLLGMKIGDKKTLTVPPEKGYGPNDYNGIPGGSTLIFDVELVGIK